MLERWRRASRAPPAGNDEAALAASGLFDEAFYLRCNRDVGDAGLPPLAHFCHFGWREGRRPNLAFDPVWYARTHRIGADENPLAHYLRHGEAASLRPVCFFDPARYRRWHKLPRRRSALAHYLERRSAPAPAIECANDRPSAPVDGDAEATAIATSGLFDPSLYLVEGPDVRAAGREPLAHYRQWGWREGRRPNLYFDPAWYRARHLGGADVEPLAHYLRVGEAAGMRPIATFDPAWYLRHYALPPGASPLAHFLANRRSQRFAPHADFDIAFYMSGHGVSLGPNRDPFAHFLLAGLSQDLDPSAGFDAVAYRAGIMTSKPEEPTATGPSAWARAEGQIPLVHFLDALR